MEKNGFRLMRLKEVMTVTGLSRAAVYAKGNPNATTRIFRRACALPPTP